MQDIICNAHFTPRYAYEDIVGYIEIGESWNKKWGGGKTYKVTPRGREIIHYEQTILKQTERGIKYNSRNHIISNIRITI